MSEALVRIRDLSKYFSVQTAWPGQPDDSTTTKLLHRISRRRASVKAVDEVSLDIMTGETLGLVGESGCGKSTLGRTMLRLLDPTSGSIEFAGTNISKLSERELRPLRQEMQIIFQDPAASLNPRMTVGAIVMEPLGIHFASESKSLKRERMQEVLAQVGLSSDAASRYPHEFSGGQRQRVGIARALICNPKFIVCDEPISALDVSIQAQIINLLSDLQESRNLTYLFISHDLQVIRHMCDRIAVMYLGKIVEVAKPDQLFATPKHPYTKALLSALPVANPRVKTKRLLLSGDVPSPIDPPTGCAFHPRCPTINKDPSCFQEIPKLCKLGPEHRVACHVAE